MKGSPSESFYVLSNRYKDQRMLPTEVFEWKERLTASREDVKTFGPHRTPTAGANITKTKRIV